MSCFDPYNNLNHWQYCLYCRQGNSIRNYKLDPFDHHILPTKVL